MFQNLRTHVGAGVDFEAGPHGACSIPHVLGSLQAIPPNGNGDENPACPITRETREATTSAKHENDTTEIFILDS